MLYPSNSPQATKIEQKWIFQPISLVLGLSCLGWLHLTPASAQSILPDTTLGAESSAVAPGVVNGATVDYFIQGGAIRGTNLFHSFLEFNVGLNEQVYFANPGSVSRIVGRVTGNNASLIEGTLGVAGNADLYLINPNGIFFGPNAQLDINGSFLASTANVLDWGNGLEFNATNPQAAPPLTIDLPVSLTFAPGNTSVLSSEGQLTTGADLTLAAERLELQGSLEAGGDINLLANQEVQIRDSAAQPFNATAQGDLLIQGDQIIDISALNHPDSWLVSGGNLTLRSDGDIIGDARFWSSGNLATETLLGQNANIFSPNGLIILAGGDVTLADYVGTFGNRPGSLNILAGGSVSLGDVTIGRRNETDDTINPGHPNGFIAGLANYTLSDGNSVTIDGSDGMVGEGTLDIRAGIDWSQAPGFSGNTILGSISPTFTSTSRADITVGDISILPSSRSGGQVFISNQYFSGGSIGDISTGSINTRDTSGGGLVVIDSNNQITLGSSPFGFSIRARPLFPVNDLSNGGDVRLLANDSITIPSQILVDGALGGNIDISTGSDLTLAANLSSISNSTTISSANRGGDVNISTAGNFVLGNGASINTSTNNLTTLVTASAGSANITALGNVIFTDGAEVISASFGPGLAGDIAVRGTIYLYLVQLP
jgi:filamentous hemagglutinin family protein